MDFWRTVVVLFRRWYITIPAFFASVGLAAAAYSAVPATYQSGSVLVLTTPLSGGTESLHTQHPNSLTNPMLNFDKSLSLAAAIVIQQMNSAEVATALGVAPGGTVNYTVGNGSSNPELLETGPFLFIQGTGPTAEAAQEIADRVASTAVEVLAHRQQTLKAPPSTQITVHEVVPTTAGQLQSGNPMRAAAAALAMGGIASLASVYGFESLMTHRRRRRSAVRQDDDGPPADGAGEGVDAATIDVRRPGEAGRPASRQPVNGAGAPRNGGGQPPGQARLTAGSSLGLLDGPADGAASGAGEDLGADELADTGGPPRSRVWQRRRRGHPARGGKDGR